VRDPERIASRSTQEFSPFNDHPAALLAAVNPAKDFAKNILVRETCFTRGANQANFVSYTHALIACVIYLKGRGE
jgi:hypothetical protein